MLLWRAVYVGEGYGGGGGSSGGEGSSMPAVAPAHKGRSSRDSSGESSDGGDKV